MWKHITHDHTGILNHKNSTLYTILFSILLVLTTGIVWTSLAAIVALGLTIIINNFILNRKQHVPTRSSIIITGCSSGIGFTTAVEFARQGFTAVFATVRNLEDGQPLTQAHGSIIPLILDVTKPDTIKNSVAIVKHHLITQNLSLTALINNAGWAQFGFLETMKADVMSNQFHTNLYGQVEVSNAFLPLLREFSPKNSKKSSSSLNPKLIFVSSTLSKMTMAGNGVYAASKHALDAIAKTYRQELKQMGIQVVIISPGPVKTNALVTATESRISVENALVDQDPATQEYYRTAEENNEKQQKKLAQEMGSLEATSQDVANTLLTAVLSSNPHSRYVVGKLGNLLFGIFLPWIWPTALDSFGVGLFPDWHQIKKGQSGGATKAGSGKPAASKRQD